MKASYPMYDLEGGMGVPIKEYKAIKGHSISQLRQNKAIRITVSLCVWYFFSASATFTNKVLIKEHHVSAEMLTMCHLFISILLDFVVLTLPNSSTSGAWRMQRIRMRSIIWIVPLSLFSVMAKTLTYWSYNAVPVSIAQTCKASQPFFNVVLAYMVYRSRFSIATYSSLVPIVFGVVMASVSEMGMNDLALSGVVFAVVSALLGVMQSMYAKFLLRRRIVLDTVNLHFYSAFVSFAINAPFVLMAARAHQDNFVASFPFTKVLLCSMMHFVGSFCSSWVLGEVSELTFSIMSTMKRVVVILSAVLYFGNPVTFQSISGMLLAIAGVGTYQLVKISEKQATMLPLPLTVKTSE
ncbi:drug metabolite transporter superfamily [Plasmopara halstedii]|uniref:Drug metabolite transporter superfamily n=1 Tax=Plasmopara halstedii TaxID=4781 RepID=A0A0N7L678_PLAHL|nr:drug metabolite transporter superfamily [Plasmopara halstedii]CEG43515.1 drug metabolite transporter superfamily [Plasmopara halstedii]|eukprot:XP_024579884.1 drug metabolite transporter superfamily [Plasmopara halstedii]